MNLETFKKVISFAPNQSFMHVGHPYGSGVLNAIKEILNNVLVVDAAHLADEVDIMEIVKQNKGELIPPFMVESSYSSVLLYTVSIGSMGSSCPVLFKIFNPSSNIFNAAFLSLSSNV